MPVPAHRQTKPTQLLVLQLLLVLHRCPTLEQMQVPCSHHLLSEGGVYHDLGDRSFDERDRHAVERRLVVRLEGLGYTVTLDPTA